MGDAEHDGVGSSGSVGVLSGGGVGEDEAEGEDVGCGGCVVAVDLFGADPGCAAEEGSGCGVGCFFGYDADAEVEDFGSVGAEHDVGGFEVSVDDACLVDGGECVDESFGGEPEDGAVEWAVVGDVFVESGSVDEFHDEVGDGAVGDDVDDVDGAFAVDSAHGVAFAGEAVAESLVGGEFGSQHFDGDGCAVGVFCCVDGAESACAESAGEGVVPELFRVPFQQGLDGHFVRLRRCVVLPFIRVVG